MPNPPKYTPSYSFSNHQTANPSRPPPGTSLDVEFQNIAASLGATVDGLKDIRRSDGKMANGIVDLAALSDDVLSQLGGGGGSGSGGVIFASQAQAEAGTSAAVVMSPLRVKQAIAALGNSDGSGGGGGPIDAYTKTQTNALLVEKADVADVYSKIYVDGALALKEDVGNGGGSPGSAANSVKAFGAVGNGTTDDTAAFEAALAALNVVYVPRGRYRLTRRLFKVGALTLHGDGEAQSKLVWDGVTDGTGGGIFVEVCKGWTPGSPIDKREECYVKDLALNTTGFLSSSKALAVRRYNTNYATTHACVVSNVTISGDTDQALFVNGWGTGIDLDGCDNTSLNRVMINGKLRDNNGTRAFDSPYGVKFHNGGGLVSHPTVLHISDSTFYNLDVAIYTDDMEGFIMQHCQVVSGRLGVVNHGTASWPHYEISQCHINVAAGCIVIDKVWDVFITNNLFYLNALANPAPGYFIQFINGAQYFQVTGNQFANAQDATCNGVIIGPGCGKGLIDDNIWSGVNAVGSNAPGLGVWLTTGSFDVVVGDGNYWDDNNIATRVLDGSTGSMFPGYGSRHAKTQAQTASSNQATVINFQEPRNAYGNTQTNMASGAFVVPSTGVWQFDTSIVMEPGVEGSVEVSIVGDGTTYASDARYCHQNGIPVINVSSPPRFLVKNTAVRVQVYPTDHNRTVAATSNRCFFEGRRLS